MRQVIALGLWAALSAAKTNERAEEVLRRYHREMPKSKVPPHERVTGRCQGGCGTLLTTPGKLRCRKCAKRGGE